MQTSHEVECPWESRRERRHLGNRKHECPSSGHGVCDTLGAGSTNAHHWGMACVLGKMQTYYCHTAY